MSLPLLPGILLVDVLRWSFEICIVLLLLIETDRECMPDEQVLPDCFIDTAWIAEVAGCVYGEKSP